MLRDKDVVLFPRKVNGKFVLLHRIWPGIQIVQFENWSDLTEAFWEDYLRNLDKHIVLDPKDIFEVNYIGAGGPPIETEFGWLLIYHGVQETPTGKIYHAKAALLQLDKPEIEIARLPYPLFSPPLAGPCARRWHNRLRGRNKYPDCPASARRPAPYLVRWHALQALADRPVESGDNRADPASSQTGNSSGRAPDRAHGAIRHRLAPSRAAHNGLSPDNPRQDLWRGETDR